MMLTTVAGPRAPPGGLDGGRAAPRQGKNLYEDLYENP
jgi:hypothetical protein